MKRIIDHFLKDWSSQKTRKPLILRGARQVGKTHAVRELGNNFDTFIEINLEVDREARKIFEEHLDARIIVRQLSILFDRKIEPGKTLLFIDEIQQVSQAILSLRYFYEYIPDLHVIAAGSLLDFAIQKVGMPVGRATQLYMYPLSFLEFLGAQHHSSWIKELLSVDPVPLFLHEKLMELIGTYIAIGGMPEAVNVWLEHRQPRRVKQVHRDILSLYSQDFEKYGKKHQVKYLSLLFGKALNQIAQSFIYARIGEYRKRELEPAYELLSKAGLLYQVFRTSGQGIPLGADADLGEFKPLFLDVGLTQSLLKQDMASWLLNPLENFVNKGAIVEAFVGQELLAYSDPIDKEALFFWRKNTRGSHAEVDYLLELEEVIPVEVKAGKTTRLHSMLAFLEDHKRSPYGIRFWSRQAEKTPQVRSFSLYQVACPLVEHREYLADALHFLSR